MSYLSRVAVGLGMVAGVILPLHYWVYLPTNEYLNYQQYLKRKQITEQYVRRMEYHCNVILTEDKKYGCQKFNEAKESGNFQIQADRKATER
jgi:hypothetical protein